MSRQNRRFAFERTTQNLSAADHFSSSSQSLYPNLRNYLSVSRAPAEEKPLRTIPFPSDPSDFSSRLNEFLLQMKENRREEPVDATDFSDLRANHLQQWKSIKKQWLKFYRDENKRDDVRFDQWMSQISSSR